MERQGGATDSLACMDVESCIDTAGKIQRRFRDRVLYGQNHKSRLITGRQHLPRRSALGANSLAFGSPLTPESGRPAVKAIQIESSLCPDGDPAFE